MSLFVDRLKAQFLLNFCFSKNPYGTFASPHPSLFQKLEQKKKASPECLASVKMRSRFLKRAREKLLQKFLSRFLFLLSDLAILEGVVEENADEFVARAVGLVRKAVKRLCRFFLNADRKSFISVIAPERFFVDNQFLFHFCTLSFCFYFTLDKCKNICYDLCYNICLY